MVESSPLGTKNLYLLIDILLSILYLDFGFLTFTPTLLVVQGKWQTAGREVLIVGKEMEGIFQEQPFSPSRGSTVPTYVGLITVPLLTPREKTCTCSASLISCLSLHVMLKRAVCLT